MTLKIWVQKVKRGKSNVTFLWRHTDIQMTRSVNTGFFHKNIIVQDLLKTFNVMHTWAPMGPRKTDLLAPVPYGIFILSLREGYKEISTFLINLYFSKKIGFLRGRHLVPSNQKERNCIVKKMADNHLFFNCHALSL